MRSSEVLIDRRARRARLVCSIGLVALVLATAVSVLAVGRLIGATDSGLTQAETSLGEASELARSTVEVATRISDLTTSVAAAIDNTDQALAATSQLTTTVQQLVTIASPIIKQLNTIGDSLTQTQQTFATLRTQMLTTKATVESVAPSLKKAIDRLSNVPAQLDAARLQLATSRHHLTDVQLVARATIVVFALVIGMMFLAIRETAGIVLARSLATLPAY